MFLLGLFNLVLHGSARTQPTVCISPTVTHQSLHLPVFSSAWVVSLKEYNPLLQMARPCSRTSGCCSSAEASSNTLQCFFPPVTPPTSQGLLDYCRTLSCSGSQSIILKCEIFVPQIKYSPKGISPKRLTKFYASFFMKWSTRQNNLSFTFDKMSWKKSEMFSHNFTHVPLVACSLEHVCLIKAFRMLAISCLSALIKVMPSV